MSTYPILDPVPSSGSAPVPYAPASSRHSEPSRSPPAQQCSSGHEAPFEPAASRPSSLFSRRRSQATLASTAMTSEALTPEHEISGCLTFDVVDSTGAEIVDPVLGSGKEGLACMPPREPTYAKFSRSRRIDLRSLGARECEVRHHWRRLETDAADDCRRARPAPGQAVRGVPGPEAALSLPAPRVPAQHSPAVQIFYLFRLAGPARAVQPHLAVRTGFGLAPRPPRTRQLPPEVPRRGPAGPRFGRRAFEAWLERRARPTQARRGCAARASARARRIAVRAAPLHA